MAAIPVMLYSFHCGTKWHWCELGLRTHDRARSRCVGGRFVVYEFVLAAVPHGLFIRAAGSWVNGPVPAVTATRPRVAAGVSLHHRHTVLITNSSPLTHTFTGLSQHTGVTLSPHKQPHPPSLPDYTTCRPLLYRPR